ncbi:MAG: alpha/beta hydrolase [Phycisphaeraceae bacterium]|nr:alpha/beta hydrolase [Phycisphaeraceae bacterium]
MTPSLVLLPGLGADQRLFDPQRRHFPNLISLPWFEPLARESLASYAVRMSERIRDSVPANSRIVLGGVSFGGMLAAEMAPLLKPDAVVLIGSALHPSEISFKLRTMAFAGKWMPVPPRATTRIMGRTFIRTLGPMKREHRHFLETMIDAAPFSFLRWAGNAIFGWEGRAKFGCKLVRLHGDRDRIIPLPRNGLIHIIRGAGHVPNVSHADEVNEHLHATLRNV